MISDAPGIRDFDLLKLKEGEMRCDKRPGANYVGMTRKVVVDTTAIPQITDEQYEATKENNDGSREQAAAHRSLMRVRDALRAARELAMRDEK